MSGLEYPAGLLAPKVAIATLSRRYPRIDVRRLQFDVEDAFRGYIAGQTQVAPPPPNGQPSPDIARFTMTDGKRTLAVSEVAATLQFDVTGGMPKMGLLGMFRRGADELQKLEATIPADSFFYEVVLDFDFPFSGAFSNAPFLEASSSLLGRAPSTSLEMATANVIERRDDFRVRAELQHFKAFMIRVDMNSGLSQVPNLFFDADFMIPENEGIKLRLAVDSRPILDRPGPNLARRVCDFLPEAAQLAQSYFAFNVSQLVNAISGQQD